MKRNYVEEILSKKDRANYNERDYILFHRLNALDTVVKHCKEVIDVNNLQPKVNSRHSYEIHKYIPIGLIAATESYFRIVIKELIDYGPPYSDNAVNLREIKFDFNIVQAIAGKKLTVGDFLSHLLPLKNFENINSIIGALTGKDFLLEIKPYFFENEDYSVFTDEVKRFPSIEDLSQEQHKKIAGIFESMKETFRVRNIFCHESTETTIVSVPALYQDYENAKKFLEATNNYIWDLIHPKPPITNQEWALELSEELKKAQENLELSVSKFTSKFYKAKEDFLETQRAWENYYHRKVEFISKEWEGERDKILAILREEIYLTQNRISELEEDANFIKTVNKGD